MPSLSSHVSLIFVAAIGVGAALAACTSAQTSGPRSADQQGRQCFLVSQVNGFTPIDRDTVDVRVSTREVFRLELIGACQDIDWALRVGIRARGGGAWVCQGLDAEIVAPGPLGPQVCQVSSIRRLTDEEIEAARQERRNRN